jgi:hypothetical protein
MTRAQPSEPSSPTDRRIIPSSLTCPGAPVKQKQIERSRYQYSDDWLMQHFDNSEESSPTTTPNRLFPRRRLFPEDGSDDTNFIQQQQQHHHHHQQHSAPPVRRQLFRDVDAEERENVSPPRPVQQQQQLRGGQVIGIVTPPIVPTESRREDN